MSFCFDGQVAYYAPYQFLFVNQTEGVVLYMDAKHGKTYRLNSRFDSCKIYNKTPVKRLTVYAHYLVLLLDTYQVVALDIDDIQANHQSLPLYFFERMNEEKGVYVHDLMVYPGENLLVLHYFDGRVEGTTWPREKERPKFFNFTIRDFVKHVAVEQGTLRLYTKTGVKNAEDRMLIEGSTKLLFQQPQRLYYINMQGQLHMATEPTKITDVDFVVHVRHGVVTQNYMVLLTAKNTLHVLDHTQKIRTVAEKVHSLGSAGGNLVVVNTGREIQVLDVSKI